MLSKKVLIFAIFLFLLLNLGYSQKYLISKENLEKILKELPKNSTFVINSIQNTYKCYFDKICVFDKPIKGFEKYFIEDKPIFKIQRLESLSILDVYRLWNTSFERMNLTGSGIKIAILDTGIDINHKDLNYSLDNWKCFYSISNIIRENDWNYCNDDNGHGTHVAGIIAARYGGNLSKCFEGYPCGVAPNATLLIAKVLNSKGNGYLIDILNALVWAINNGAEIISMSFGIDLMDHNLNSCYPSGDEFADAIRMFNEAIDEIAEKYNIILVAAAGNNPNSFSSPACAKNVIAVGAIDKNKNLAYFSSRGPIDGRIKPDIVAPGVYVNSTVPTGICEKCDPSGYKLMSGTSMATPFVSGIAALLLEALKKENINYTSQEIKALILTSPNELKRDNAFGSGIINATELIRIRKNFLTVDIFPNETLLFVINSSGNELTKITIYRHEFNKSNFANILVFDNNFNLIKFISTSDNVIQFNFSTSGIYYLIANFVNSSNITFTFSHKICNALNYSCINYYQTNGISYIIGPWLNIKIEEPIEYRINKTSVNFLITIKDFGENLVKKPVVVNVSIKNSSDNIVFYQTFSNQTINFSFIPSSIGNYKIQVIAISENRWGIIEKTFYFLPFEVVYPKNVLKLMQGDLLNITIQLSNNLNISNAFIFLKDNTQINQTLNFVNVSKTWYNVTKINLSIPGLYYLFLNITNGEESYNATFPLFEFNNTFSYLIDCPSKAFADKNINVTFKVFHVNGTELKINKRICLSNESLNIVCNTSNSSEFILNLNVSIAGYYNLSFFASDSFGNFLILNRTISISFIPDTIRIQKNKNTFTIFEPLNISLFLINSSNNQPCLNCTVFVNISYINGTNSIDVISNIPVEFIINQLIPPVLNGTYNFTFFAKVNPLIVNSTQIDIITANIFTNVSQKVFPNFINVSINISIDRISNVSIQIAKINTSGTYLLKPLEDFFASEGCGINSAEQNILWCNITDNIILVLNTSETSTYEINITSFNDTANGFLSDRFYSGFLIRPTENLNRFSCSDIRSEDTFLNPYIRNHCFIDEKNQKDLVINSNETLIFNAYAYAGATLDRTIPINVSINVSYNNTQIYYNSSNFYDNEIISFKIFNFSKLGIYKITLNYTFENIQKIEEYYVDVFEINHSYFASKNYTKVGSTLSISLFLNRTNSTYFEIPNNISKIISFIPSIKVNSFTYDNSNGTLLLILSFSQPIRTNLTLYLEDELGVGKNVTIYNLTAYDYTLELTAQSDTVFVGSQFLITINPKLLPDNRVITYNYSVSVAGGCNLMSSSSGTRNDKTSILLNATSEGDCTISVTTNSTYLDMIFLASGSITISILPKQAAPSEGIPSSQKAYIEITAPKELYVKKGYSNSTIIFIKSVGRTQNIFAYILDYPQNLAIIIPRNKTILANDEEPFILNISIPKEEDRSEFEITLLFNSSYASNTTKIKIKILSEEIEINQTKVEILNENIRQIEKEISEIEVILTQQKNEELLNLLLEVKQKVLLAKSKMSENNIEEAERLINETKEILNYVKSKMQIVEEQKEKPSFNLLPLIIIVVLISVGISAFLIYKFLLPKLKSKKIEKPYYDYKRGKFVWTKEDESVWEKLKEKWRRRQ